MAATGPSTPEGKAIVSRNATSYGLYARDLVLPFESEDDWQTFLTSVIESLTPEGAVESALAERIAEYVWRGRRISRAERELVLKETRKDASRAAETVQYNAELRQELGRESFYAQPIPPPAGERVLPSDVALHTVIKYEAHINRQLFHAMHELEALQERRRGNASPLARVDIHGFPGA